MTALTADKLNAYHDMVQKKIDEGGENGALSTKEQKDAFEESLALKFDEHFAFQNMQARAHVSGKLSTEAAQIIYLALGEVMSSNNGGWKPHVDLAWKVTIRNLMAELAIAGRTR